MKERKSEVAAGENLSSGPGPARRASTSLLLLVGFSLLLVGGLIFRDFIFGDKLLLYKDVGDDSVIDTYPSLVHLSHYIRTYGFPSWSFCVGMGQSLFHLTGDLILEPVVWLPQRLIAGALVYQHLLKTVVAGLCFCGFLHRRGVAFCASLCGGLLLAFSAHMCAGSCWMISGDDTLCFTFLLFAVEGVIAGRRWILLPIAIILCGLVTVFHLYLSALLLCLYIPARLTEIHGWKPLALSRSCFRLAALAFLGVGLGAIVFFASSAAVLNTPRASGAISNFAFGPAPSPFQFESALYYITAVLRWFSNDMVGTGDGYRGWENYYEGPLNYCGLLPLLIVPQVFAGGTRRQRLIFAAFLFLLAIPVVFPWFRYAFWLFQGGYFRTFSLFSVFVLLVLSMTAFSRYVQAERISLWTLGATLALLLAILYCPNRQWQELVDHGVRWTAAIFLFLYAVLILFGQILHRQRIAGWLITLTVAVEIVHFDGISINRPTVTKQEWQERIGYNDETVDVVRDLKRDDASFFRITKTWGSVEATRPGYNDSMVFGYYGTSSYSTYNNINYFNFLLGVNAIEHDRASRQAQWSPGLLGFPLLSTFACEKYIITPDPGPFQAAPAYELVRRYGPIYLFRNNLSLPFGLTFEHYIPDDLFARLSTLNKGQALLQAVVLSEKDTIDHSHLSLLSEGELERRLLGETSIQDAIRQRRETAMCIQSFTPTHFTGIVHSDQDGMLVFQMPFDTGWHAKLDGQAMSVFKVDLGLLGMRVPAGEHQVHLDYSPPFLGLGGIVTCISSVIFLVCWWRWPRILAEPVSGLTYEGGVK